MVIIVICSLMEKKFLILRPIIKMLTFRLNFVHEVYLIDLVLLSLKGNVYDFLVDYNSINKSDILNIHKYLIVLE